MEDSDYSTVLKAWDFRPGSRFVQEMDEAIKEREAPLMTNSRPLAAVVGFYPS